MAIYHFSMKIISRGRGHSAVAAAAYRSQTKLVDQATGWVETTKGIREPSALAAAAYRAGAELHQEANGIGYNYAGRKSVLHAEIMAPEHAPDWVYDRQRLWSAVEAVERRSDSQLARDVVAALPHELTHDQRLQLLRTFIQKEFVDRGMVADFAIHKPDNDQRNFHAHIMLTMRHISADGFGPKNREWNAEFATGGDGSFVKSASALEGWRERWSHYANEALRDVGREVTIDHRSLKDQGIDRTPGVHRGKGHYSGGDRAELDMQIANDNRRLPQILIERARLEREAAFLRGEYSREGEEAMRDKAFEEWQREQEEAFETEETTQRKKLGRAGAGALEWHNQRMDNQNEAAQHMFERNSRRLQRQTEADEQAEHPAFAPRNRVTITHSKDSDAAAPVRTRRRERDR